MGIIVKLKHKIEQLPEPIGRPLSHVPFAVRLGRRYRTTAASIREAESLVTQEREARLLRQTQAMVRHAFDNVAFYREFYKRHGFAPNDIRVFEDVSRIPIVTKADLQSFPLESRCATNARGMKVNTGGTSGQPLEFLLDRQAFAREWAHMHHVWRAHGYRPQHLKITFRGKHFDEPQTLRYNAVHNEYVVNANSSMGAVVEAITALPSRRAVRWLHGYPSLIAEFAHAFATLPAAQTTAFQARLYGVLLGSEYPAPAYRDVIAGNLSANIVSWYGHSEMAILARETAQDVYVSYPTYGLSEAVSEPDGAGHRLVCTSLHNRAHPFIRYDTGDLVAPASQAGGVLSFRIREGRVGDFVLDRRGRKLALTAIIFGRHHSAFSLTRHVQVCDQGAGKIVLVITPQAAGMDSQALLAGFDLNDLDIDLDIRIVDTPIRTPAGKIRLKVDPSLLA